MSFRQKTQNQTATQFGVIVRCRVLGVIGFCENYAKPLILFLAAGRLDGDSRMSAPILLTQVFRHLSLKSID